MSDTDGTQDLPLVSIVTPSLGQGRFIEDAIRSVLEQDYPRVEHIVVDGGSKDETLDVLKRYPHLTWVSEHDRGQADAVNKGFRMAQGEIFGWLNADDMYLPGAVSTAVAALRRTGAGLVHGGWRQIDEGGATIRDIAPVAYDHDAELNDRNAVCQPGALFTREAFEAVGGLDPSYHYAMDYELWLKLGARFPVTHVDAVLGAYRLHPASKTVAETSGFWAETVRASRAHGGRRFSRIYVDWYLPRARPWLYRVVRVLSFVRSGDMRGLGGRVAVHAKTMVPVGVRHTLRVERDVLGTRGARFAAQWNLALVDAWTRDRLRRGRYALLDEAQVRAARRSDRVFVYGSGASMNDIPADDWARMAEHDTFGFNAFYWQQWIRVDFQLFRGGTYGVLRPVERAKELAAALRANPRFADTVYLMQDDFLGHYANFVVGGGYLPARARLFRYRTAPGAGPPTRSFAEGVRHAPGTLVDAVNCAYCLGWKEIVLVGIDLYDSRYYWLPPDKTLTYDPVANSVVAGEVNSQHGNRAGDTHNTVTAGIVGLMGEWRRLLEADGVQLSVHNPKSLLSDVLPVFEAEKVAR